MYNNKTTKENYKEIFGVDLDIELGAMPNDTSNKMSSIMIAQIESLMIVKFSAPHYRWNGNLNALNEHQLKCFKNAVCWQIEYIINSGSFNHSGFDIEKGQMISPDQLRKIEISLIAHDWMRKGGLANIC